MLSALAFSAALLAQPIACNAESLREPLPTAPAAALERYRAGDFDGATRLVETWWSVSHSVSPADVCMRAIDNEIVAARAMEREEAAALRARVLDAKRARTEALIDERRFDEANAMISELRTEGAPEEIIHRLEGDLVERKADWPDAAIIWTGNLLGTLAPWLAVLFAVLLAMWLVWRIRLSFVRAEADRFAKGRPRNWRVLELRDDTRLELGLALGQLLDPPAPTEGNADSQITGLLQVAEMRVDQTLFTVAAAERVSVDLVELFDAAPSIGGVSFGSLFRLGNGVRRWWRRGFPHLTADISVRGDGLGIVLVARASDMKLPVRVLTIADGTKQELVLEKLEEAAFKMLLALSALQDSTAVSGPLSLGARELAKYLDEGNALHLRRAAQAFEAAESRSVANSNQALQAKLYRGAALDLLEDHHGAIRLFAEVQAEDMSAEGLLKRKAQYNEAIALMRQYDPESLEQAKAKLNALIAVLDGGNALAPISQAALANVVAHKLIFWTDGKDIPTEPAARTAFLMQRRATVDGWLDEAKAAIEASEKAPRPKGKDARKQLDWAVENAKGNLALNEASGILRAEAADSKQAACFKAALAAFSKCEKLFKPGVETLTNLATSYLGLGRYGEAATYAARAVEINRNYEYGYYRLAQAKRHLDGDLSAKTVLRTARRRLERVGIPGFKRMFQELGVAI